MSARAWWDASAFPLLRDLEAAAPAIAGEVAGLRSAGLLEPRPIARIPADERTGDQRLIEGEEGGWEIFRLHYNGLWFEENGALCPVTMRVLHDVPGLVGTAGFGVLLGGTRIRPHCGLSNAKIRVHLGIDVPEGCGIRVGRETRTWEEGRCLVFDDSFEHAVWNVGASPRTVLVLDLAHPSLSAEDAAWVAERSLPPPSKHDAIRASARWPRVA